MKGGKGVNQTLIVKDRNFTHHKAKLTQVLWQLICYIHLFDNSNKKTEEPNYERTQLEFVIRLVLFWNKLRLYVPKLTWQTKKHSDIDCQVDLKPQIDPLYTQVVRISIKTCDMTTAALSISRIWWCYYGNARQKGSWANRRSFWFHARGWGGLGDDLQVTVKPPLLKEMSWIIHVFITNLRRTKKVVESIHVGLVVSVQCGERGGGEWSRSGWDDKMRGEEECWGRERGVFGVWGFNSSAAGERLPWWWGPGRRRWLHAARRLIR